MTTDDRYYGNIHPPYTDKINSLKSVPVLTRMKDLGSGCLGTFLVMLIIGVILAAIDDVIGIAVFEEDWVMIIFFVLSVLTFLLFAHSAFRYSIAHCPYCAGQLGTNKFLRKKDRGFLLQCDTCSEYLINDMGKIRACAEADVSGQAHGFIAPVFKDAKWPGECMVCGKPPTQRKEAKTAKFEAAHLLFGSLAVSFGSVKNIPYCDEHVEAIAIKVMEEKLKLVFPTLSSQRRYLAINRYVTGTDSANQ